MRLGTRPSDLINPVHNLQIQRIEYVLERTHDGGLHGVAPLIPCLDGAQSQVVAVRRNNVNAAIANRFAVNCAPQYHRSMTTPRCGPSCVMA